MKYLEFNTENEALARSGQEAISRGCGGTYTAYWWVTRVTKAGKYVLLIADDDQGNLTPSEISELKTSVVFPDTDGP